MGRSGSSISHVARLASQRRGDGMRLRVTFTAVMLLALASLLLAQDAPLTASQAKQYVGSTATVCGKVMSPRFASSSRGQPTFLNLDKAYPNQEFTILIWGSD